jgi:hypothetical protein
VDGDSETARAVTVAYQGKKASQLVNPNDTDDESGQAIK